MNEDLGQLSLKLHQFFSFSSFQDLTIFVQRKTQYIVVKDLTCLSFTSFNKQKQDVVREKKKGKTEARC